MTDIGRQILTFRGRFSIFGDPDFGIKAWVGLLWIGYWCFCNPDDLFYKQFAASSVCTFVSRPVWFWQFAAAQFVVSDLDRSRGVNSSVVRLLYMYSYVRRVMCCANPANLHCQHTPEPDFSAQHVLHGLIGLFKREFLDFALDAMRVSESDGLLAVERMS